jgi:hypothetical protein
MQFTAEISLSTGRVKRIGSGKGFFGINFSESVQLLMKADTVQESGYGIAAGSFTPAQQFMVSGYGVQASQIFL